MLAAEWQIPASVGFTPFDARNGLNSRGQRRVK